MFEQLLPSSVHILRFELVSTLSLSGLALKSKKSLSELKTEIELLHNNLDNVNARDKEIYVEKVLLGWSNDKISAKHYSLTRQQISRIVKKVEEDLKM